MSGEARKPAHRTESRRARRPWRIPSLRRRPAVPLLVALAATVATAGASWAAAQLQVGVTGDSRAEQALTFTVVEDAYVSSKAPRWNWGLSREFSALTGPAETRIAYVKFNVTGLPSDATVVRSQLKITRTQHHLSGAVDIREVTGDWRQESVTWNTRPALGALLAHVPVDAATMTVTSPVPIKGNGPVSVAVTSPNTSDSVRFLSAESGGARATLSMTYTSRSGGSPTIAPTSIAPTSIAPTTPAPRSSSTPSGPVDTLFGASPGGVPGENPANAFKRINAGFGDLDAVRWWPADWSVPKWSSLPSYFGNRAVSMSMKLPPAEVAAGTYDAALTDFFLTAPTDRQLLVTYFHEPEDDINNGAFTVEQYKAAWARFDKIARANRPKNVRTAMILMHGTFRGKGYYGHPWTWYTVPGTFQVMGADVYQFLSPRVATAAEVVQPVIDAANSLGLPFAILELGTRQNSPNRAQFLKDVISMTDGKALMVLHYESWRGPGGPWNIIDVSPDAQQIWREKCAERAGSGTVTS